MGKKKLIYALALLAWAEIVSFVALSLISKKYPLLVYKQGSYDAKKVANNLDDELGWGSDNVQISSLKASGCRLLLFGDSFVEADTYKEITVAGQLFSPEDYLAKITAPAKFIIKIICDFFYVVATPFIDQKWVFS